MAESSTPSPIVTLPPELLTRVFDSLSCDRPHVDIASSRLVSKRFRALSSPFLVNTAVIANRLDTLAKLRELLDHPYFSKYVTRLVWDRSSYHKTPAESLEDYQRQCEHNPWQSSAMRTYRKSVQDENAAKAALLRSTVSLSSLVGQQITPILNDDDCPFEMAEKGFLRRGHDDYHHRYHAQLEMSKRRLDLRYLHSAFEKLPKLRHFEFSDFRALSRNGENLGELCERLFGQTMSPDLLPDNRHCTQRSASWNSPGDCLVNLAKINPQLKSLSFGRSAHSAWDALQCNGNPFVSIPGMLLEKEEERWRSLLGSLRYLSLPIKTSGDKRVLEYAVPSTRMLLSSSATSLTHLCLETELYSGVWRDSWNIMPTAAPLFANFMSQIHFQSLTSIVFRGWLIPLRDLIDFLLAHATTLRNMHLINCCLEGASKDELVSSIESRLEPALALTGVEIYALMYEARCLQRHQYKLRQRQRHIQELSHGNVEEDRGEKQPDARGQVRLDRTDLEELFLGGRHNAVTRIERKNSDLRARSRWWREIDEDDSDDEPDDLAPSMSPSSSSASESKITPGRSLYAGSERNLQAERSAATLYHLCEKRQVADEIKS